MKMDRLIGILTLLLEGGKHTAPQLAARFEVSRRTILRDIDALCRAGIPVVTTQGEHGGIAIMEGYRVNKSVLTLDEAQSLAAALRGMDTVMGESASARRLMAKLAPEKDALLSLPGSVAIDLSSYNQRSLTEKIALLRAAIAEERPVAFDYYTARGESVRVVEPCLVEFRWSAWYMLGWCRDRGDFRRFKLSRAWNVRLLDEHFTPRPVPDEQLTARDALPDLSTLELLIDPSARYRLVEDYGPDCYVETPDGLRLTLGYTNREYIIGWVLGFGDRVEVLAPEDVRDELLRIGQGIVNKYQRT